MTVLSDYQLYEVGMLTDEIAGFRALLANPRIARLGRDAGMGLAPDHFRGIRLERFTNGANIAANWLKIRRSAGNMRRKHRASEIAKTGACTPIDREQTATEAILILKSLIGERGTRAE